MTKKIVKFGTEARKSMLNGINIVVSAVQTSVGPKGRTSVIAQSYGAPVITNDGVTIAKSIELDGIEQAGAQLIQQAASKTNDIAGDGTSTTTILAGALINEGVRMVEAGSDPVRLRVGIKKAVDFTLSKLNQYAKPITTRAEKANVATISSRNPEIGEKVAKILEEVGNSGVVTVQTGDSNEITTQVTIGMQFDKGYKSPYFVTDNTKMEAVIEKPLILVTDKKISSIQDILPVIEQMAQSGKKDLVLIADDIEGEALATFVVNKVRGIFNVFAVQAPSFGDKRIAMLEDIAILTGATFISEDLGMSLKKLTLEDLGTAEKVLITKDTTTIVSGGGDKAAVEKRADNLRINIKESTTDYEKEKLNERLAKLVGGVGVIKVGAATEVEMKELKYVVEDALNATKAAIAEGVVAGGGSTLVRLAKELESLKGENDEENLGINIVKKALLAPFRAIASNSGIYDIALIQNKIESAEKSGYDFNLMIEVADMFENGIIDPKMVIREAIMNSSSIAGSVITTEVVVVDAPVTDKSDSQHPSMAGMDY
jgi:chaperonin GroEL